jgi:hypothetical protein
VALTCEFPEEPDDECHEPVPDEQLLRNAPVEESGGNGRQDGENGRVIPTCHDERRKTGDDHREHAVEDEDGESEGDTDADRRG